MVFQCGRCGKFLDDLPKGVLRCPECAYKVLYRVRDPLTKNIKAR